MKKVSFIGAGKLSSEHLHNTFVIEMGLWLHFVLPVILLIYLNTEYILVWKFLNPSDTHTPHTWRLLITFVSLPPFYPSTKNVYMWVCVVTLFIKTLIQILHTAETKLSPQLGTDLFSNLNISQLYRYRYFHFLFNRIFANMLADIQVF